MPDCVHGTIERNASSPTEEQNQVDLHFLNFSHPSEARASRARRAVRSHVTRQQHQREHAAAAARRAQSSSQSLRTDDHDSEQGRRHSRTVPEERPALPEQAGSSSSGITRSSTTSSSPSPPVPGPYDPERRVDPRTVYPERWQPSIPQVLEHYVNNIAVDNPDLDGSGARGLLRTSFLPLVLTDVASLHAIILMAASHYASARGPRSHEIDVLQLRGLAIREINGALEQTTRATSDQLVAAVAQMAWCEAVFGDRRIFHTHMAGLLRMVGLRGGLSSLGLGGLLERLVLWIDANAAHISGGRVYFDRASFPSAVRHPAPDMRRFTGGLLSRPAA